MSDKFEIVCDYGEIFSPEMKVRAVFIRHVESKLYLIQYNKYTGYVIYKSSRYYTNNDFLVAMSHLKKVYPELTSGIILEFFKIATEIN